jgi:hypothetical protein
MYAAAATLDMPGVVEHSGQHPQVPLNLLAPAVLIHEFLS